jgi:hypothetical protein
MEEERKQTVRKVWRGVFWGSVAAKFVAELLAWVARKAKQLLLDL